MFYNLFYILFYKILSLIKKIINIPIIIIRTIIKNIKSILDYIGTILLVILFICTLIIPLPLFAIKEIIYANMVHREAGQIYFRLYIKEFQNNPNLPEANKIMYELGNDPITVETRTRRAAANGKDERYVTSYKGGDPDSLLGEF